MPKNNDAMDEYDILLEEMYEKELYSEGEGLELDTTTGLYHDARGNTFRKMGKKEMTIPDFLRMEGIKI